MKKVRDEINPVIITFLCAALTVAANNPHEASAL